MENKEIRPSISLSQIEEIHFSLTGLPEEYKIKLRQENPININVDISFIDQFEHNKIGVSFSFKYFAIIGDETRLKVLEYDNITWFTFKNMPSLKKNSDGTLDIPEHIIKIMLSPAYSTARGIIYSRTAHTYLGNALLPLTDSNQLFEHFKMLQDKDLLNQQSK